MRRFALRKGGERITFNLSIHRLRKTKKGLKNILEFYGAFATNMGAVRALEAWRWIPEEYRRRWGTGDGVQGGEGLQRRV